MLAVGSSVHVGAYAQSVSGGPPLPHSAGAEVDAGSQFLVGIGLPPFTSVRGRSGAATNSRLVLDAMAAPIPPGGAFPVGDTVLAFPRGFVSNAVTQVRVEFAGFGATPIAPIVDSFGPVAGFPGIVFSVAPTVLPGGPNLERGAPSRTVHIYRWITTLESADSLGRKILIRNGLALPPAGAVPIRIESRTAATWDDGHFALTPFDQHIPDP
jgi:hypothetical protein